MGKKIIAWFNENRLSREFGFKFREKESYNYWKRFPLLILMLKLYIFEQNLTHLVQIHYESLCLRMLVSYSVRIEDASDIDASKIISVGQKLFRACCLYDNNIFPSMWCFS